jgi:hypothetical protein
MDKMKIPPLNMRDIMIFRIYARILRKNLLSKTMMSKEIILLYYLREQLGANWKDADNWEQMRV